MASGAHATALFRRLPTSVLIATTKPNTMLKRTDLSDSVFFQEHSETLDLLHQAINHTLSSTNYFSLFNVDVELYLVNPNKFQRLLNTNYVKLASVLDPVNNIDVIEQDRREALLEAQKVSILIVNLSCLR